MITVEEVLLLHYNSIADYGGSSGVRDINLLKSAVIRPFQHFEGVEQYPSAFQKAAAIFESIIKNHPFVDGNKRTGFLAAYAVLYKKGFVLTASNNDAYNFVVEVSSSNLPFEEIVIWFHKNSRYL